MLGKKRLARYGSGYLPSQENLAIKIVEGITVERGQHPGLRLEERAKVVKFYLVADLFLKGTPIILRIPIPSLRGRCLHRYKRSATIRCVWPGIRGGSWFH